MKIFLRVLIGFTLFLIGGLLFLQYDQIIHYVGLAVFAFLVIAIDILYANKQTLEDQLSEAKDKISSLTILKGNKNNIMQIAVFPKQEIIKGIETQINIFITSSVPIEKVPDIKIITESKWSIKISNQVQKESFFANKYEYILNQSDKYFRGNHFTKYSLFITLSESGKHDFEIVANNGDFNGSLRSSLTVNNVKKDITSIK